MISHNGKRPSLVSMRFTMRHQLLSSPLGHSYARTRKGYQGYRLEPGTDMVVEGFPRSANTYAWYALRRTLEPNLTVRGHTHAASNVLAAVKNSVPTMLIIRNPDDAVASLVQQAEGVSLEQAFRAYSRFHRACYSASEGIYLAQFEDVVQNFSNVVDDFYRQNSLCWPRYLGTEADENAVRDAIDEANRQRRGGSIREAGVARPSKFRLPTAQILTGLTPRQETARRDAANVYRETLARLNPRYQE